MNDKPSFQDWLDAAKRESELLETPETLWQNIEREFDTPSPVKSFWTRVFGIQDTRRKWQFALAGLVILIATSVVINSLRTPELISVDQAEYLAEEIDSEVYTAQRNYERAIAKLENQAKTKYQGSDNELVSLYLERIDVLDELIRECKSDLKDNPYNPAIQRSLFAAYNEKVETIHELLSID